MKSLTASKSGILDFFWITLGTWMTAVGIYFFKFPNHFSTGGISGLSIILNGLLPSVKTSYFITAINLALLLLGLLVLGKAFSLRTVYASLLLSFSLQALERFFPLPSSLTSEPMLDLCFSVLLPAAGSAVLFNLSASTGGTDIVAMILKKYTSLHIGTALFCVDFLIAVCSGIVFGLPIALYSLLGLFAKALVVDNVIESINLSKYFFIVTDQPELICDFIRNKLHRSATVWRATGAYTHDSRSVVLTVLKRNQAVVLRQYVHACDTTAFVIISNTSEIIGKGFRSTQV